MHIFQVNGGVWPKEATVFHFISKFWTFLTSLSISRLLSSYFFQSFQFFSENRPLQSIKTGKKWQFFELFSLFSINFALLLRLKVHVIVQNAHLLYQIYALAWKKCQNWIYLTIRHEIKVIFSSTSLIWRKKIENLVLSNLVSWFY